LASFNSEIQFELISSIAAAAQVQLSQVGILSATQNSARRRMLLSLAAASDRIQQALG